MDDSRHPRPGNVVRVNGQDFRVCIYDGLHCLMVGRAYRGPEVTFRARLEYDARGVLTYSSFDEFWDAYMLACAAIPMPYKVRE